MATLEELKYEIIQKDNVLCSAIDGFREVFKNIRDSYYDDFITEQEYGDLYELACELLEQACEQGYNLANSGL